MTRRFFIERTLRQIYGGYVTDDSEITVNLVNTWLNDAIGQAARINYSENIKIDAISFVNNSFYTTYKGISVSEDEKNLWKFPLPHIPYGLGTDLGVGTVELKDEKNNVTHPLIPLTQNQRTYYKSMRPIPNKFLYYSESAYIYIVSTLLLNGYTAQVTTVSGGNPSDLDSVLNVPDDYMPIMVEYIKQQLLLEKAQPQDTANDGADKA
jgi:hypothetical protein